jgi:hypothetical protein
MMRIDRADCFFKIARFRNWETVWRVDSFVHGETEDSGELLRVAVSIYKIEIRLVSKR